MTTFLDRQKELFNQLKAAEELASHTASGTVPAPRDIERRGHVGHRDRRIARHIRAETRQFRGRESIFKRPEAPLRHCLPPRVVPGYLKDPEKWTRYNLENVPDVSARSNAEALAACRKAILADSGDLDCEMSDSKIVFKTPILLPDFEEKPKAIEYKNSVVVYPEYVVGQKSKTTNKVQEKENQQTSKSARPVLKLDHLEEEGDEEE